MHNLYLYYLILKLWFHCLAKYDNPVDYGIRFYGPVKLEWQDATLILQAVSR